MKNWYTFVFVLWMLYTTATKKGVSGFRRDGAAPDLTSGGASHRLPSSRRHQSDRSKRSIQCSGTEAINLNPTAVKKSSSSLRFSWTRPSCPEFRDGFQWYRYLLTRHNGGVFVSGNYVRDINTTTATIHDLDACTQYTFSLYVYVTNWGYSTWDRVESIKSIQTSANITVNGVSPYSTSTLRVLYTVPENCHELQFVLNYTLIQREYCPMQHIPVNTPLRSKDINTRRQELFLTGLERYSTYRIAIFSKRRKRTLISVNGTTSDFYTAPVHLEPTWSAKFGTKLQFSWKQPPCEQLRGTFVRYEYALRSFGEIPSETSGLIEKKTNTSVTLKGLTRCTNYEFSVRLVTESNRGQLTGPFGRISARTLPSVVSAFAAPHGKNALEVSWTVPRFCTNHSYEIIYELVQRKACPFETVPAGNEVNLTTGEQFLVISNLESYAVYNITVINHMEDRANRQVTGETEETTPSGPPTNVTVKNISLHNLTFNWRKPRCNLRNGPITHYEYVLTTTESGDVTRRAVISASNDQESEELTLGDLEPWVSYSFKVRAINGNMTGTYTREITAKTLRTKIPGIPGKVETVLYNTTTAVISWSLDDSWHGDVIGFDVTYGDEISQKVAILNVSCVEPPGCPDKSFQLMLDNLSPATKYTIQIRAFTVYEKGPPSENQTFTTLSVVPYSKSKMTLSVMTSVAVIVVIVVIVIVIIIGCRMRHYLKTNSSPHDAVSEDEPGLSYINQASHPGEEIELYHKTAVVHPSDETTSTLASRSQASISDRCDDINEATISIPNKQNDAVYENLELCRNGQSPIPLDELLTYLRRKNRGNVPSLEEDYKTLPPDDLHPSNVASREENRQKNRFKNILPYDHSRVVLDQLEGDPHSDYFNASFIDGVKTPSQYIASQGPNTASLDDFWRMVWQYDCKKICMLANLVENGKNKCANYWAGRDSALYGDIRVSVESENNRGYYMIRLLKLQKKTMTKTIEQFQFTAWPDMGVPEYPAQLMAFIQATRDCLSVNGGPTLVHCSAGVGRSGTYITLDAMLDQADADRTVDVYNFIARMRQNRPKMVQVPEQYRFIFEALGEHLTCGDTSLSIDQFLNMYPSLVGQNDGNKSTALRKQFQLLEATAKVPREAGDKCAGKRDVNIAKNRYKDRLPADQTRPFLMTEVDGGNDYINASFLPGFTARNQFIGTQTPLPQTVGDFWRLIMDYKVTCIVQLHGLTNKDKTDTMHAQYWINKGEKQFGPYMIKLLTEETRQNITSRTLEIRDTGSKGPSRTVCQLQLDSCSTTAALPPSVDDVVELIKEIEKAQARKLPQQNDGHPPLLFHCSDGETVTGVVCALVAIVNRLKSNRSVEVFHACKKIKAARHRALATLEQYKFLHEAVASYLKSETIYENVLK